MLARLPAVLRGPIAAFAVGANTLLVFLLMVPPALVKLAVPALIVRGVCDRLLNALASAWVGVNNAWIQAVNPARWDVKGVDDLHRHGWYLVSSNHQSWVDILVLQRVFHGHIPFLKFFLKQELIWVPFLGLAWWALDLPFLKRKKGTTGGSHVDLETTRKSCERFKLIPTSVINFCEGTRFTLEKHALQRSPYSHLLKPKSGGMAVALSTMGAQFHTALDVTIHYAEGIPTMWDYLSDRVPRIVVDVKTREIPAALLDPKVQQQDDYRAQVQRWLDGLWVEKDELIGAMARG
jgi:1-acyl-sn-glycerol-3-phosphate acyltransferase